MKSKSGFTIVELLVVIVVIAILAAISIVVYGGMQARAENTKTITAVAAYAKSLQQYKASEGAYPVIYTFPCLGGVSSVCGSDNAGGSYCWGVTSVTYQAAFATAVKTHTTQLPEASSQSMKCNAGGSVARGAFYGIASGSSYLYYYLKGNVECGTPAGISGNRAQAYDTTACSIILP